MTTKPAETLQELRRKAEEKIASQQASTGEVDAKRLLHELQVHQIELEMQNIELHLALSEMREHKTHLENVIKHTPAGYFHIDMEGRFLDVNNSWLHMHRYDSADEVIGKHFRMMQVDSESDSALIHLAELQRGVAIPYGEFSSRRKDGSVGHHIFSAHPVLHVDNIVGFEWFIIDITTRKLAEDALKESEWKFQALFDNGPIGVAYHSMIYDDSGKATDYNIIDANQKYIELTGVDPRGKTVLQSFPGIENDPFDWIGTFGTVARTGEAIHFESYLQTNDRWYNVVGYQYKPDHFVAAFFEITKRKLAEKSLQRKQDMLARTESISHIGSWEWDVAKGTVSWSDELFRIVQLNPADGAPSFEDQSKIYHPDDMKELIRVVGIAQSEGTPYEIELRAIRPNGDMRICLARGAGEKVPDGKITHLFGSLQDITERKQVEEVQSYLLQISSLHHGEDFFESLARYLAQILGMDYVCIDRLQGDRLSAKTLAVYYDGRFEDNVEYTLKDTPCGDVVGKEVCVFPRDVRNLFPKDEALQELQAESYVGTTLWSFDMKPIGLIAVIGRKELNSSHFAETVLKLVSIRAAGELERRQAEEDKLLLQQQFQQTQRLESLGVLAGGIAHDFNNILAIIMGYCALTKMDYETTEHNIPHIEKAVERAAALCRQMLAYAGKAQSVMAQVDMTEVVAEMVTMLKATTSQNVSIRADLPADMPYIKGDASQLRQVVMNLIINASEAIGEEQGVINVSLARTEIKAGQSDKDHNGQIIPAGHYICLEVADNGCGMNDEIRQRIFEPFYSTKFAGRGLGMSALLGILTAHKGALQLSSEPGKGTNFKVYLPARISAAVEEETAQQTAPAPWKGSGIILLAEDEEQVALILKTMLAALGFTVIEAADGKEALELYLKYAAKITLVVTDMDMPVMDGYELFRELKTLNPKLPIIISSGYGDTVVTSRIAREDIAGLVSKPYNFDQLREVLRRVVGDA